MRFDFDVSAATQQGIPMCWIHFGRSRILFFGSCSIFANTVSSLNLSVVSALTFSRHCWYFYSAKAELCDRCCLSVCQQDNSRTPCYRMSTKHILSFTRGQHCSGLSRWGILYDMCSCTAGRQCGGFGGVCSLWGLSFFLHFCVVTDDHDRHTLNKTLKLLTLENLWFFGRSFTDYYDRKDRPCIMPFLA